MPLPDASAVQSWLEQHPAWVAAVIALVSFVESFAILGIAVPGVALLGAAAFVAGSGALGLPECLLAAFLGAVAGDGVSFLLGRIFHQDIKRAWPFRHNPEWIANGERFFARYGAGSVAIGRFVEPIRPVIPLVAGILNMPARAFFAINVASALGWAPVYILPGYLLGAAVDTRLASPRLLLALAVVALAAGGVVFWAHRRSRNGSNQGPGRAGT
ncbi:MAG: DedA family protein [Gammaproteobacteria bacterium]|nr:DedA family protein [Gammaproteobacteria bacterium]MBK9469495.1 DedA family protein [Gammaproteobacteria bacterium]MBP6480277.1 DedA family protein [Pseudomonadales bacterium]MBP7910360.1 DedA family protein [Pseudomonadales bacterium]